MKVLITETQLKRLIEQPDSHFGLERFGYNSDKPETLDKAVESQRELNNSQLYRTILQIVTNFIPVFGTAISLGLVSLDAARDFKNASTEQEKKNIVLSYVIGMAFVWGLGKVFKSVASLGESGMKNLSIKMRRSVDAWKFLSTKEMSVLFDISSGQKYWVNKLKK